MALAGCTLGIIGYGRSVAPWRDRTGFRDEDTGDATQPVGTVRVMASAYVDLETLLRESDVVTLHCPLTPETTRNNVS